MRSAKDDDDYIASDPDGLIGRGILKGGKITKMSEIPPASKLTRLIEQAVALNKAGSRRRSSGSVKAKR
jgi:hypothetical protein